MKTLVLYYSLSGNTKWIAERLAGALNADLCAIETKRAYPRARWLQMVFCGASAVFRRNPKLKDLPVDLRSYDSILLGTPVWAGTYAAPLNTLFHGYGLRDKSIALFATSGGEDAGKCLLDMKKVLAGNRIVGESSYRQPLRQNREEQTSKALEWARNLRFE